MTLDRSALDRHITGNYGADQYPEENDYLCPGHSLRFIGDEPNDYDYPETGTHLVYACSKCGELFDRKDCRQRLRSGENCALDLGHRGRHSSVSFYCESCGKTRRGTPFGHSQVKLSDGSIDDVFDFCFLCVRGLI